MQEGDSGLLEGLPEQRAVLGSDRPSGGRHPPRNKHPPGCHREGVERGSRSIRRPLRERPDEGCRDRTSPDLQARTRFGGR
jgi:hypothetical protein